MTLIELFTYIGLFIASLGGGGALVFAMSGWLGKVWANRLMLETTHKYGKELKSLEAELAKGNQQFGLNYQSKIELYKAIASPLIELAVALENTGGVTTELLNKFEKERLTIASHLGMFSPLSVFEKFNSLIDYLYNCLEGKETYTFHLFRYHSLEFFTEIRKDIGVHSDELIYRGSR